MLSTTSLLLVSIGAITNLYFSSRDISVNLVNSLPIVSMSLVLHMKYSPSSSCAVFANALKSLPRLFTTSSGCSEANISICSYGGRMPASLCFLSPAPISFPIFAMSPSLSALTRPFS